MSFLNWCLAAAPIALVLVLMVGFRWGGARAGPAGWFAALIIGAAVYQGGPELIAYSQLKGVLLTLYVLYIIWMALVLYQVVETAGAIKVIGSGIVQLTSDRVLQLLILAWAFSAFLQGVAGFGVPIAVVAPLLIGLGFDPVLAVASTAIGHSWSVTFGDIASSFNALIASSGLTGEALAPWSAALLAIACFGCGLAPVHAFSGWRGLRRGAAAILIMGTSMALTQYLLATHRLWNLAGFVAGLVGLAVGVLTTRLPIYRRQAEVGAATTPGKPSPPPAMGLWLAVSPYLLLIAIVSAAELWGPAHHLLDQVQASVRFPQTVTGLGWTTPAGLGRKISIFGHPGALLAYTSVLAYVIFRATGHLGSRHLPGIVHRTLRSAIPSSIGIASMVGMAMIMDHCGMTYTLAQGLSSVLGGLFPFLSPFIGLLGAFMTGSNTNSNVVFAPLQKSTAGLVGISALVILGAQTTGGALGSMLAPAKVIVGCSTTGLAGQEGRVMRITVLYGLLLTAVIGAATWLAVLLQGSGG